MAATIINDRGSLLTDPIRNFRFLVTFLKLPNAVGTGTTASTYNTQYVPKATLGFTSVSGLAVTTESIPYREGGYNTTVHQIPGQTSFSPITLQRGVTIGSTQNWDWMRMLFKTVEGSTARTTSDNFRVDLEIAVLSHPIPSTPGGANAGAASATDHVAMRFHVYNAFPTAVAYSDLNAGDNALFVEQMTLVHEGFDCKWAADLSNSAGTDFSVA
ncbi:MAG: phage tail protein [Actinobacteria bacterium]|nr:phage tail protein [Actinomycetota bacterium]